jgi:PAS domain S-box-containing protein
MQRPSYFIAKDLSLRAFVVAAAIVGVAVAARAALDQALPETPPFITLFPAVALAGLLCGPVAASSALFIGVLAALFFWIPPRYSFSPPDLTGGVTIALFVLTSAIVLWATALLRAQLNAMVLSRATLDLGQDVGGMGLWAFNLATGRIEASSAAHRLHGLPEDARRTKLEDWLQGVDPSDADVARESLSAAVAGGAMAAYSYRVKGGENGPRWINARGRVVSTGGERRLVCALVDVTDQVRVQQELERERERLRLALEAGALAVWEFRPDFDVVKIDARYAVTMGLAADTRLLTRAEIASSMHPEDIQRVSAEHDAAIAAGGGYRIEYRIVDPAGRIRWVVSKGIMLKGDLAAEDYLVGVIQDITEQKVREDQLKAIATTREMLIREADHRIKNSLQMVIGLLQVQLRELEDHRAVDAVKGAIARVGAIAASHLALQDSEDFRELDLALVLGELCNHFGQLHPAAKIVCEARGPLMLDADRAIPLGLMVSELLTNALRHGFPPGAPGRVTVGASVDRLGLHVHVLDDGVGMTSQSRGGGLGSKIIRSLTTQLGADLHIDSAPGAGTVVRINLSLLGETG